MARKSEKLRIEICHGHCLYSNALNTEQILDKHAAECVAELWQTVNIEGSRTWFKIVKGRLRRVLKDCRKKRLKVT